MSTLRVIANFLELERNVRQLAMSDDVSKNLRQLLEDACDHHHQRLIDIVSVDVPPKGVEM